MEFIVTNTLAEFVMNLAFPSESKLDYEMRFCSLPLKALHNHSSLIANKFSALKLTCQATLRDDKDSILMNLPHRKI